MYKIHHTTVFHIVYPFHHLLFSFLDGFKAKHQRHTIHLSLGAFCIIRSIVSLLSAPNLNQPCKLAWIAWLGLGNLFASRRPIPYPKPFYLAHFVSRALILLLLLWIDNEEEKPSANQLSEVALATSPDSPIPILRYLHPTISVETSLSRPLSLHIAK